MNSTNFTFANPTHIPAVLGVKSNGLEAHDLYSEETQLAPKSLAGVDERV